jgi:hypothetical protein
VSGSLLRWSSYGEALGLLAVLVAPVVVTLVGVLVSATPLTMGLAATAAIFWQQSAVLSSEEDSAITLPGASIAIGGFSLAVVAVTVASQHV